MPVSLHIGGADLVLANSGEPALSTNSDAITKLGETIEYESYIYQHYYNTILSLHPGSNIPR